MHADHAGIGFAVDDNAFFLHNLHRIAGSESHIQIGLCRHASDGVGPGCAAPHLNPVHKFSCVQRTGISGACRETERHENECDEFQAMPPDKLNNISDIVLNSGVGATMQPSECSIGCLREKRFNRKQGKYHRGLAVYRIISLEVEFSPDPEQAFQRKDAAHDADGQNAREDHVDLFGEAGIVVDCVISGVRNEQRQRYPGADRKNCRQAGEGQ